MAILKKKQGSNRAQDEKFIPLALDSKGMPTEPILNKSKTQSSFAGSFSRVHDSTSASTNI